MTEVDDRMRAELLSLATEDRFGLWDAWWQANGSLPELPVSGGLAVAETAIAALAADGLICLFRGSQDSETAVPSDEVAATLRQLGSWIPDDPDNGVYFTATDKGHKTYFGSSNPGT